jgi:Protein of unknown function (DUF3179)
MAGLRRAWPRATWMLLVMALIVATFAPALVAIPMLTQTPALLAFAHAAAVCAPALSLVAAAALTIQLWRARTWGGWALLGVTLICAWLSRVNMIEWMFSPAPDAETVEAGQFHDVRDSDMVIGVTLGGQSRAYPVRYLAYHHMLNDRLGDTWLLPTY